MDPDIILLDNTWLDVTANTKASGVGADDRLEFCTNVLWLIAIESKITYKVSPEVEILMAWFSGMGKHGGVMIETMTYFWYEPVSWSESKCAWETR